MRLVIYDNANQNNIQIGEDNIISELAVLGTEPEHLEHYQGKGHFRDGKTVIGGRNRIREFATIHAPVTERDTVIGDGCFIMTKSHIAHGCHIGNNVIMSPGAMVAGECTVMDGAYIGMGAMVHQYTTIGAYCMIGMNATITKDVPPFLKVVGVNRVIGINEAGVRRALFEDSFTDEVKSFYHKLNQVQKYVGENVICSYEPYKKVEPYIIEFMRIRNPDRKIIEVKL